jgi:hemerythrin-like domain-containing protein
MRTDPGAFHPAEPGAAMRPTEFLLPEHRWIESALDCLERIATPATPDDFDAAGARAMTEFLAVFADTSHHGKEEDHLFAAMVRRGFKEDEGPVAVMSHEHVQGRDLLSCMAEAIEDHESGEDAGGALERFQSHVATYAHLMRRHIEKEDSCLFQLANAVLDEASSRRVLEGFAEFEAKVFEGDSKERMLGEARELCRRFEVDLPSMEPHGPDGQSLGRA